MADVTETSLSVPFGVSGGGAAQVIVESHRGSTSQFRVFPADPAMIVRTSHGGGISKAGGRVLVVQREPTVLSGAKTISTEHPITRLTGLDKSDGAFFDKQGNEINPNFTFNSSTKQLEVDIEVLGFILISYESDYQLYDYVPKVTSLPGGGASTQLDTIYAFLKGSVGSLKINPITLERNYQEVITMYSEIVIQEDGPHEKPANFPTDGIYPPPFNDPANDLPTDNFYIQKRTHLVYYADFDRLHERKMHTELNPPDGNAFMVGGKASGNLFFPEMKLTVNFPEDATANITSAINNTIVDLQNRFGATL